MLRTAITCALAASALSPALAQDRIGETCTGTERVTVGDQAPRTVPYSLTFSANLATGYYCYGPCTARERYGISNSRSNPIRLADYHGKAQSRLLLFDRKTGRISDSQTLEQPFRITREAQGQCRPAPFHEPGIAKVILRTR